jgi:hypothetical protein
MVSPWLAVPTSGHAALEIFFFINDRSKSIHHVDITPKIYHNICLSRPGWFPAYRD